MAVFVASRRRTAIRPTNRLLSRRSKTAVVLAQQRRMRGARRAIGSQRRDDVGGAECRASRRRGSTRSSPSARGSSGDPGTANTSRPCSVANRAVMSEPERRAASTTSDAERHAPRRCRLRRGKVAPTRLPCPSGISLTSAPRSSEASRARPRMFGGIDHGRRPPARTATVAGRAKTRGERAHRCPRARPETTTKPSPPSSRAIRSASDEPRPRRRCATPRSRRPSDAAENRRIADAPRCKRRRRVDRLQRQAG